MNCVPPTGRVKRVSRGIPRWQHTSQAEELGQHFLGLPEDQRPTAIFSSPYYRCLQTAKPVSVALNVPIYVEHGLSEWYSPVVPDSGLHPRPESASSLKKYFPQIDPDTWESIHYPSRKGEEVAEVHRRCDLLLEDLLPWVEERFSNQHKRILLVSHAAIVIALARSLSRNSALPVRVGCCSLTQFDNGAAKEPWKTITLATGGHLTGGSSREWGFEDIEIADGKVVEDPGEKGTETEEDKPVGSVLQAIRMRWLKGSLPNSNL